MNPGSSAPQITTPPAVSPVTPPTSSDAPAGAAIPKLPDTWPGAFGVYKYSRKAVMLNLGTLAVLWLLTVVVSLPVEVALKQAGQLIAFVVSTLTAIGFALTYIAGVRAQRLSIGDAISRSWPLFLKALGLNILVTLSLIASMLLLVIPFFFVLPRLTLATYFLVDRNLGVIEAYKASWAATKDHVGKVYGIIGATLLMALIGITIIGIPFAIYFVIMYSAANVVLYEFLNKSQPRGNAPATTSAGFTAPAAASLSPSPVPGNPPQTVPPQPPQQTPPTVV